MNHLIAPQPVTARLTKLSFLLFLAWFIFMASPTYAQDTDSEAVTPPKSICETADGFGDFDFWVGEWEVYSNDEKRTFQGNNSITKHHQNCLIMENWTSAQGGKGSSMNYFDPVEDSWRQLWVAGGYSIDYTGGLDENGAMSLAGKINYYQQGTGIPFRGTWTLNEDGTVRQFFEQQNPETGDWVVWFDGLYVKK
jgi:hypothetical protein